MPAAPLIDKAMFLAARECMTRGWFLRNGFSKEPPSIADSLRMREGGEIGRRARTLFAGGVFVPPSEHEDSAAVTQGLMADPAFGTVFEATFVAAGLIARADILTRCEGGWRLVEVKSHLNDDKELVEDLAFTATVMHLAGVPSRRASLFLLSRDYRLGMGDDRLFVEIDHSDDVAKLVPAFAELAGLIVRQTGGGTRPPAALIKECKDCEFFRTECLACGIDNHILELPRLSDKKLAQLVAAGVTSIGQIPASFDLTDIQTVIRAAVIGSQPIIEASALVSRLNQVRWPAAYLDFETMKTAIPVYPGIAPHQQIPTQYSLHVCDRPGNVISHREFLADASRDCRRELCERLLADLSGDGSIVVYSGFEKRVLTELSAAYPDLSDGCDRCIERLFDLEPALKPGSYYHPAFGGRSSIKATLPVLVNGMTYGDLQIGDGDTAMALFATMARGDLIGDNATQARRDLLDYCKHDSLAMVRLHARLVELSR